MKHLVLRARQNGQGMTEYIIIVALISVAAIGVYQAFGDIVRGQTALAASTLAGGESTGSRTAVTNGQKAANNNGKDAKNLTNFEEIKK